jgi:hypothetical protein
MKVLGWIGLSYAKLYDPNTRKATLIEAKKYIHLFLEFLELYGFDISNEKPTRESKIRDYRKRKDLEAQIQQSNKSDEEGFRSSRRTSWLV